MAPTASRRVFLGRCSALLLILLGLALLPPTSTGKASPAGWTTRFLFTHGAPVAAASNGAASTGAASNGAADPGHRHNH